MNYSQLVNISSLSTCLASGSFLTSGTGQVSDSLVIPIAGYLNIKLSVVIPDPCMSQDNVVTRAHPSQGGRH